MKKTNESKEALVRILVLIITGIILGLWEMLVTFLVLVNFVLVLATGKRNKSIAVFCEMWNTQTYVFSRYITFVSNERPFPFNDMSKNMSKFE